jgi:capsular polysaccharide transport system permease protein
VNAARALDATPLSRSLAIQARVVHALLVRELITRYGRHNIGFMWLFVEPMLFTVGVVALWTATRASHGSTLPIVPFALTGYSSVLLWRNAVNRCANAVEPNKALLFHRNVRVLDFFAARLVLEIAGATLSLIGLSCAFIFGGWMEPPRDLLKMIVAWALLAWFAAGLGLVVGAACERSEAVARLWHTATYLIFPLSGAVFMIEWLPPKAQQLAVWVPMVNATELLRDGYFGDVVRSHYDVPYLVMVNLVLTLAGLCLVRAMARRVEGG